MAYYYVTYHALTDRQRVFVRRLFRLASGTFVVCVLTLGLGWLIAGWPYEGDGMVWFWRPSDVYGLFAAALYTLGWVCTPLVTYALRQYWVDYKVRKQTEGISGLYKFLNFVTFCLFVVGAIQLGRFVYVAAYLLPTSGWGAGLVWSKRGEEVYEVTWPFSSDDKVLLAKTRNGGVRAWSRSNGREQNAANLERFPSSNPTPVALTG